MVPSASLDPVPLNDVFRYDVFEVNAAVGGRLHVGTPHEIAEQTAIFTRHGIERIVRYAFEIAAKRPRRMLQSATKSNALRYGMVLWDEVAEEVSKDYASVNFRKYYVDAIAARHGLRVRRRRGVTGDRNQIYVAVQVDGLNISSVWCSSTPGGV